MNPMTPTLIRHSITGALRWAIAYGEESFLIKVWKDDPEANAYATPSYLWLPA